MMLSIIIVNYNVKYFLHQCLKSIHVATKNIQLEILVVDNNSVDNSVDMLKNEFPDIKLILNKENIGFSRANNQAIQQAQGKYILLLNPDTIIQEDTLHKCVEFLENNITTGSLGVKMINGNGEFLPESKRSLPNPMSAFYKIFGLSTLFPKSKKFGQYHLNYLNNNNTHEIDVVSGAFFMTRKKILDEIGMLDESFFMYGEDIDLSYRIQKAGYKNIYFPDTSIIHYKGESTKKTSLNYIVMFYKAMIIFVKKHYSRKKATPLIVIINTAILIRALLSIVKRLAIKITQPLIDSLVIFSGMYFLQNWWAKNYFLNENYYSDLFFKYTIPGYIIFWLLGIYLKKGYKRPYNLYVIPKGIAIGTIIMLIIYGLLPEQLRFSRALIILGSILSMFSIITSRFILSKLRINIFQIEKSENKRIGIVANSSEFDRISEIIQHANPNINFIGQINSVAEKGKQSLGNVKQIKEILIIHQLNEIIFSAKDINSNQIMHIMSEINNNIKIKISPSESTFIIGSNSIHKKGELYAIHSPMNKKNSIKAFFKKYIDFFN